VIDFKEEINKYAPALAVDDIEGAVNDEMRDMMDMLQHITQLMKNNEEQEKPEGVEADDLSQLQ